MASHRSPVAPSFASLAPRLTILPAGRTHPVSRCLPFIQAPPEAPSSPPENCRFSPPSPAFCSSEHALARHSSPPLSPLLLVVGSFYQPSEHTPPIRELATARPMPS